MTCVECRFSCGTNKGFDTLECRRRAPVIVGTKTVFPLVDVAVWCGELEPKMVVVVKEDKEVLQDICRKCIWYKKLSLGWECIDPPKNPVTVKKGFIACCENFTGGRN